jgi:hypothetical protein
MKTALRSCLLVLLCASSTLFSGQARAQCSARDVMRSNPKLFMDMSSAIAPAEIQSAAATEVWRSLWIGTFASKWALYQALDTANCGMGDSAQLIFIEPNFTVSGKATRMDLVSVQVAELGFTGADAELKDIYARAQKLGFALAAAEVGPQLRLQYLDQPIGEFVSIGMEPMKTRGGESSIFTVGNGGAGLLLLGAEVSAEAKFDPSSRFVFVRPPNAGSAF